ncbi:FAD-dependent sensor of blue light [Frondihabitans australicus]|uniref:FAD-dependent sensor of blue light n=1 Tax=Frondihabitans australicus TaxID=386892 RepID=A0A495IFN7_9MICO|nr:FAD-dependent sensor of blue light [Frondihabitans australicus]
MNSRASNRRLGITGLLLHDAGRFVQILEGEPSAVEDRYARIAGDPRHTDVRLLLCEEEDERRFPNWSMGYRALNDPLIGAIPGFDRFFDTDQVDFSDGSGQESPIHGLLERFRSGDDLALSVSSD